MKSLNLNNSDTSDVSFKDVVIVGNGPSAISLSFFLSGNWPYLAHDLIEDHPDEAFRARLKLLDADKSLLEHDLVSLSLGLDGRSLNPVSLLFDALQNPGADLGLQLPSMLEYKCREDKQISHIVLGKGKIGGSWTKMPQDLRTLSLSSWMSLPKLSYDEWLVQNNVDTSNNSISDEVKTRAEVRMVAKYYSEYVKIMNLQKFFRDDSIVFKITQIKTSEKCRNSEFESARWLVHSFDKVAKKTFVIACNQIVLANGSSDLANQLEVKGENNRFCLYDLPSLEKAVNSLKATDKEVKLPVCVIGAGLSAADAVILLRSKQIKVIHVYRTIAGGFLGLPPKIFPEYCDILKMMRNSKVEHENYTSMPETKIKEIKSQNGKHFVTVQSLDNEKLQTLEVSFCGIFIGARPDLQMLNNLKPQTSSKQQEQINLQPENIALRTLKRLKLFCEKCRNMNLCFGLEKRTISSLIDDTGETKETRTEVLEFCEDKTKPLDVRTNVLAVNKFSNELTNLPKMFALGPLVGDNFVRFIAGGSMLVCSKILKES